MAKTEPLTAAIASAAAEELDSALKQVKHCLDQLTDEQIWHRPGPGQNSIANLLLHVAGNLKQWIVAGLGGAADQRDRPREFADDTGRPKATLEATIRGAKQAIRRQSAGDLQRVRRIQGFDVRGLAAMLHSIAHFRGHTQEITFRTRLLVGDQYRFALQPATKEQGA
jgi:hypothetical protein